MKKIILASVTLSLFACTVQKPAYKAAVDQISAGAAATEGIYYYLPKTAIRVEVTAEKTIEKTGPFYRYSQRYLNLSDVITEDSEQWRIGTARITTTGVPHPNRRFRITAEGTPSAAAVSLTPNGILRGLNLFMQPALQPTPEISEYALPQDAQTLNFDDVPFTEEQLLKTSTAAMAEEVAKEIYRLRQSRSRILASDAQLLPPDEGAYQSVLNQLDEQEKKFLSLFKGKKVTHKITRTFFFMPDTLNQGNQVLFRFSAQNGFLEPLDVSGTPVYIDLKSEGTLPQDLSLPATDKNNPERGLVYCIPATARVKIIDRTVLLTEGEVQLGQFGALRRMPSSMLDIAGTIVVVDPATGGLLQVLTGANEAIGK